MPSEPPVIQFLTFEGCPNAGPLRAALIGYLGDYGLAGAPVEDVDVEAANCPEALRHWPSPTILVDGVDLFGDSVADGAACRIYGQGGMPDLDDLNTRLQAVLGGVL